MSPQKTAKIKIYNCLLYTAHQAYQNWTLSVNLMNIKSAYPLRSLPVLSTGSQSLSATGRGTYSQS